MSATAVKIGPEKGQSAACTQMKKYKKTNLITIWSNCSRLIKLFNTHHDHTEFCAQFYWAQRTIWYDQFWASKLMPIGKKVKGIKSYLHCMEGAKIWQKQLSPSWMGYPPESSKHVISQYLVGCSGSVCLFVCSSVFVFIWITLPNPSWLKSALTH